MGLFDWLRRRLSASRERTFAEVEGPKEYEAFVGELAELLGKSLSARCLHEGRAVSLEIKGDGVQITHVQEGFFADVEALLPALNRSLPTSERRQLVEFRGDNWGGVAFVDEPGVTALRKRGLRVFTRAGPRDGGLDGEGYELGEVGSYSDGAPRRGVLARDANIDGIPCAGGMPVTFGIRRAGARGSLQEATRSEPFEVGGLALPAGTTVHLSTPSLIWDAAWAQNNAAIEEVATVAGALLRAPLCVRGLELPAFTELEHHEDGRLLMAVLGGPITLAEGPYLGRTLAAETILGTRRDGGWDIDELPPPAPPSPYTRRMLDSDETVGGCRFPAGTELFTRDGELDSAVLPRRTTLDSVPCEGGFVTFSLGKLASASLTEDFTIDGLRCRAGTSLLLWSDGALSEGTLEEPAMVAGIPLPVGARVGFWEGNANPAIIVLPSPTSVRGRECIPGQVIELDEDGAITRWSHLIDERHRLKYVIVDATPPFVDGA